MLGLCFQDFRFAQLFSSLILVFLHWRMCGQLISGFVGAVSSRDSLAKSRALWPNHALFFNLTHEYTSPPLMYSGGRGGDVLAPGARGLPAHLPREQGTSLQALQGPACGGAMSGAALPCLALPCLALPCLALPCIALG